MMACSSAHALKKMCAWVHVVLLERPLNFLFFSFFLFSSLISVLSNPPIKYIKNRILGFVHYPINLPKLKNPYRYLDKLLVLRKHKHLSFEPLIHKIKSRISCWKIPLLSKERRNTLVKLVVSTIPIYIIRRFWNSLIKLVTKLIK